MHKPPSPKSLRRRRTAAAPLLVEVLEARLFLAADYTFATFASLTGGGKKGTGAQPQGMVIDPATGDIYGSSTIGGAKGYGVVFKIPAGTNDIVSLVSFNGKDGIYPRGGMAILTDGQGTHIYGTASSGGPKGWGTVYDVTVSGTSATLTTLINFIGTNGSFPLAGLVEHNGHLFGTTNGAQYSTLTKSNVFEVTPDGTNSTLTVLASFNNVVKPMGTLVVRANGDIFGTTTGGGKNSMGTVFEVVAGSGVATTLASFKGSDGQYPYGGLIDTPGGTLYGITAIGGGNGLGTVFSLDPSAGTSSTITRVVSFGINGNGNKPVGTLLLDNSGAIFGTTTTGGSNGVGTVFKLEPGPGTTSQLTTLFNFRGTSSGINPTGGLVMDAAGDIFGETFSGGPENINRGTIFELIPAGAIQTPVKLAFTTQPTNAVAGQAIAPDIVVEIRDVFGNVVTGDNDNVTLQINSSPAGAVLSGTVTVAAVNGVATFPGITLDKAGTYTLTATDGVRTSPASTPFNIRAGAATQLVFSQTPIFSVVGQIIAPPFVVKIEDAFGNVVTTEHSLVTLSINTGPGGAVLSGTRTITAVNGIATFASLKLDTLGDYTLTATDGTLTAATSNTFSITQSTKLVFTRQPASAGTGSTITPAIVVKIQTAHNVVIGTENSAVTLLIFSGPTGAVLSGTTTVNAVNGVATFPGLSLDLSGSYTLEAIDGSFSPAISNTFKIT